MTRKNGEQWGAASGYLVFVLGIAAAAFERGAPPANAPLEETLAFMSAYSAELRIQSLLFVLSACAYLWFFGNLRSFLLKAEGEPGRLANVVFGAGVAWAGLQMVFQSVQVALAMISGSVDPAFVGLTSDLAYALSVTAYAPMAVMLLAVTVLSLRAGAFPAWLGWLSAVSAAVNLALLPGLVLDAGPFVPGGALTYMLYLLAAIWVLAATTVMVVRLGRPTISNRRAERAGRATRRA